MQAKTINRLRFHISHQRNPPGPGKLEEMNQMKISAEIGSATRLTAMASLRPSSTKGGVSHHAASFVLTPSHSHRIRDVCRWPTACTTIVTAWKQSQLCQQLPQLCNALIVLCAFDCFCFPRNPTNKSIAKHFVAHHCRFHLYQASQGQPCQLDQLLSSFRHGWHLWPTEATEQVGREGIQIDTQLVDKVH